MKGEVVCPSCPQQSCNPAPVAITAATMADKGSMNLIFYDQISVIATPGNKLCKRPVSFSFRLICATLRGFNCMSLTDPDSYVQVIPSCLVINCQRTVACFSMTPEMLIVIL